MARLQILVGPSAQCSLSYESGTKKARESVGAKDSKAFETSALSAAIAKFGPASQGRDRGRMRISLLPGLDLMLRADARDAARLAAQRICEEYVVLVPPVS